VRDIADAGADTNALKRLWDQHAAALWRYAWRLTGDPVRAQDVVQETLLQAWQHPEVLTNGHSPRGWLFAVARNMVIDERSARLRDEVICSNGALVGDAMAQLSAEHRAVVGRSYYRGWTTAQIAADLGIADGAVKSRLHYALRAMRQALLEMGVTQ
jgi:RNA polymerase sigma-70 factor, ECF subfamily